VDDSEDGLFALETLLSSEGYRVVTASHGRGALDQAHAHHPDLILLDVNMPSPDGYEVTRELKADAELRYSTIVLLTARDSLEEIVYGLSQGADDYITKPYAPDELRARVAAALRIRKLYLEIASLSKQNRDLRRAATGRTDYANIIGASKEMQIVFDLIERIKDADVPVLVLGESGTGKELVASALHFQSIRREAPFLIQNCAALNEQLLESELFGHVKGAFTGALRDRAGLFESADKGTLFLDEVGEMSPALQAKLLRVLQDGTFTPVGSHQTKRARVRVVAATHRDLRAMVKEGRFREDLFYRLNVVSVPLPALRDRPTDIPLLAEFFLDRLSSQSGTKKSFSEDALAALVRHGWPGNVRELQSEVQRAFLLTAERRSITAGDFSPALTDAVAAAAAPRAQSSEAEPTRVQLLTMKEAVSSLERRMIETALEKAGGNKSEAARALGISRSNLITKVQEYFGKNEE
jgi:DNA-binding NtrC family response regulator